MFVTEPETTSLLPGFVKGQNKVEKPGSENLSVFTVGIK